MHFGLILSVTSTITGLKFLSPLCTRHYRVLLLFRRRTQNGETEQKQIARYVAIRRFLRGSVTTTTQCRDKQGGVNSTFCLINERNQLILA